MSSTNASIGFASAELFRGLKPAELTRLERKLTFDFRTERYVHDDAANQRLKVRPMRKPWHL